MSMNLKSINEIPVTEAVTEEDYIMAVQDGQGKRLPASALPSGGAESDAVIQLTIGESITGNLVEGSFENLVSKLQSGKFVNIILTNSDGTAALMKAVEVAYDAEVGIVASVPTIMLNGITIIVAVIMADNAVIIQMNSLATA